MIGGPVFEAHEFFKERQAHGAGRAVSLFGDDEFDFPFCFCFFLFVFRIIFGSDEQADDVGVLFDGAGFPEVGQAWSSFTVSGARLGRAVELGQHDDGDIEFFGRGFEARGNFGDFDLPVFLGSFAG